jgi:DNA-binding IclR family transcriptional regulator
MLAAMPPQQRREVLDAEARVSEFDRDAVERHVTAAITRGYAINHAEWRDDIAGVGVAIFGGAGELRAAVSVSLPTTRLEAIGADSVADVLLASQRRVSAILR